MEKISENTLSIKYSFNINDKFNIIYGAPDSDFISKWNINEIYTSQYYPFGTYVLFNIFINMILQERNKIKKIHKLKLAKNLNSDQIKSIIYNTDEYTRYKDKYFYLNIKNFNQYLFMKSSILNLNDYLLIYEYISINNNKQNFNLSSYKFKKCIFKFFIESYDGIDNQYQFEFIDIEYIWQINERIRFNVIKRIFNPNIYINNKYIKSTKFDFFNKFSSFLDLFTYYY